MTAVAQTAPQRHRTGTPGTGAVLRFESEKLFAQWRIRVLLGVCWLVPGLAVAVIGQQSSLPADTIFGRWMGTTGWAGPLVVLGFACNWALPLLTSVVAGDSFAGEDRLGTWRHLMTTVRSPRRIFVAKAVTSAVVVLLMVIGIALSSIVGGLLAIGAHPLIGLDGRVVDSSTAGGLVCAAWLYVAVAALAFAAVGLLGSVLFGRSPAGLLVPAVFALVLQLAQMLPLPAAVRMALPSEAFVAWRGLFTDPIQARPLVIGLIVSLVWTVVATALAYLAFRRRDFTDLAYDGAGRRAVVRALAPLVVLVVLGAALVGVVTPSGWSSGIERAAVERSVATSFAHLYRLQSDQLHRPAVTEQQLATSATCSKGGADDRPEGPGNDWRCIVTWHIPGAKAVGTAIYQLDVAAEGRYVADGDGPKEVNGYFLVRTPHGDVPNPLWQVDGLIDLSSSTSKG